VYTIVKKVRSGQGLDTFRTIEGAEFNYIGALILLLLIPVAIVLGWEVRYWRLKDERDFKKRFRIKEWVKNK
jgi:hypothetical protein